eukprot:gene1190-1300_t
MEIIPAIGGALFQTSMKCSLASSIAQCRSRPTVCFPTVAFEQTQDGDWQQLEHNASMVHPCRSHFTSFPPRVNNPPQLCNQGLSFRYLGLLSLPEFLLLGVHGPAMTLMEKTAFQSPRPVLSFRPVLLRRF